jgi:hypothetical protein
VIDRRKGTCQPSRYPLEFDDPLTDLMIVSASSALIVTRYRAMLAHF